jgi:hypothetical protein
MSTLSWSSATSLRLFLNIAAPIIVNNRLIKYYIIIILQAGEQLGEWTYRLSRYLYIFKSAWTDISAGI